MFCVRIKTISPLISRLTNEALLVADHVPIRLYTASAHWRPSLVSDKRVPAGQFQSVSPGSGALVWFSCSQRWEWMVHIIAISNDRCLARQRHLSSCWRHLLSSASRVRKSTEPAATQDFRQSSTPDVASNRPDRSTVDYRLLRVIQECAYQKQQGASNIADELWLLTEWHIIFHKVG